MLATLLAACSQQPPARQYELKGQILGIDAARNEVLIRHGAITGFMPAMTMPFPVKDAGLLSGKEPGDLVTATLVVTDLSAHLSSLTRTGHAPIEAPPPTSEGPRVLVPGEPVADAPLVDQRGKPHPFSAFKGHRVAVTFIYTRCPLPEFCPLMDRHFVSLQKDLKGDAALKDVKLVTISFDPTTDTPEVLTKHAKSLGADLARWTFLTGDRDDVDQFASRFGVAIERSLTDQRDITHNLRTAVIDADGKLVKSYTGNEWKPEQLLADLKAVAGAQ